MGNCQAAEADMLVIQHPSGRMERFYWSMTAKEVMSANPGHYAAVIVTAPTSSSYSSSTSTNSSGKMTCKSTVQLLKLLSPDDMLLIGRFYYLVTFEDVLKVFGSKRCMKLSKLLARQERRKRNKNQDGDGDGNLTTSMAISSTEMDNESEKTDHDQEDFESQSGNQRTTKWGQWKPTLQSIAKVGN
ncbi:hypothetical protein LUZ60_006533 [Juncus effusus]|nr:hypothetical protein LUZ60_006533 [Juncus effusus]